MDSRRCSLVKIWYNEWMNFFICAWLSLSLWLGLQNLTYLRSCYWRWRWYRKTHYVCMHIYIYTMAIKVGDSFIQLLRFFGIFSRGRILFIPLKVTDTVYLFIFFFSSLSFSLVFDSSPAVARSQGGLFVKRTSPHDFSRFHLLDYSAVTHGNGN